MTVHLYTSTACWHGECGGCRATCKYCDEPCQCGCHPGGRRQPEPWVDQARGIALELLDVVKSWSRYPDELMERIADDPGLFWLRGEVQPRGTWREPEKPQ